MIRNRVKALRMVSARELKRNARNWRKHPEAQSAALQALLEDVGFASAVIAREEKDGSLTLLDGHLRADLAEDAEVPVLVLDVTKKEADRILATFDPVGALADVDFAKLEDLLKAAPLPPGPLDALFAGLLEPAAEAGEDGEDDSSGEGKKKHEIKVTMTAGQMALFEKALRQTGKKKRGEGLAKICWAYLHAHDDAGE